MDKYLTFAYRNLGLALLQQGKNRKGDHHTRQSRDFFERQLAFEAYLGFAYSFAGKCAEALESLNNSQAIAQQNYVSPYNFAIIFSAWANLTKPSNGLKNPALNIPAAFPQSRTDC